MAKERNGYVFEESGKWFARVTFTDETGKRRNVKRTASTKTEAKGLLRKISGQFETEGKQSFDAQRMTFVDLSNFYVSRYLISDNLTDLQKSFCLRDWKRRKAKVKMFCDYFGNSKIRNISYGDLYTFRACRLKILTKDKKLRSTTTINRELAYLRRIFNIALQEGWILKNPFNCGEPLIQTSAERRRERILTFDEEARLLQACEHPQRGHLKSLLIALLDTGARKGEMLKLQWKDVDLESRLITIQALNTKTLRKRQVSITKRLFDEFVKLRHARNYDLDSLVFGITDNVRKSFSSACRIAGIKEGGIDGLTIHCLRHTAATRLVKGQLPIQMVGRILGHTQPQTTYRYLSANGETLRQAASILEAIQENLE